MIEQGSPEWFALRCGLATASRFSEIVTGTGEFSKSMKEYAAELAADRFAGRPLEKWGGNFATDRGLELEPRSIATYELLNDVSIEKVGFHKVEGIDAGCSPDGLINHDGVIEIKNLMPKGHVQMLAYWKKHQKPMPSYIPQLQGEMWVTGREWNDLFYHSPDLPHLIIRVMRDEAYITKLIEGINLTIEARDEYVAALRGMI